jgi:hypothetical protein
MHLLLHLPRDDLRLLMHPHHGNIYLPIHLHLHLHVHPRLQLHYEELKMHANLYLYMHVHHEHFHPSLHLLLPQYVQPHLSGYLLLPLYMHLHLPYSCLQLSLLARVGERRQ